MCKVKSWQKKRRFEHHRCSSIERTKNPYAREVAKTTSLWLWSPLAALFLTPRLFRPPIDTALVPQG